MKPCGPIGIVFVDMIFDGATRRESSARLRACTYSSLCTHPSTSGHNARNALQ